MLLLARGTLPSQVQEQALAWLATPLRWDVILERAMAHEVYPLLYRSLRQLGFPGVPAPVCTTLEALYKINAFRNVHLAEELAQVLHLHSAPFFTVLKQFWQSRLTWTMSYTLTFCFHALFH
jgi:hypothetical protein